MKANIVWVGLWGALGGGIMEKATFHYGNGYFHYGKIYFHYGKSYYSSWNGYKCYKTNKGVIRAIGVIRGIAGGTPPTMCDVRSQPV